jgi:hypothetical protein
LLRVSQERGTLISKTITYLQLCRSMGCNTAEVDRFAACNQMMCWVEMQLGRRESNQ